MTPEEIEDHLQNIDSYREGHPVEVDCFSQEMADKHYGFGPLLQAWCFFHEGWVSCQNYYDP